MWIFFFGVTIGWNMRIRPVSHHPDSHYSPKYHPCVSWSRAGRGNSGRGRDFSQHSKRGQGVPHCLFWVNFQINWVPGESHVRVSSMRWLIPDGSSMTAICLSQLLGETGHGWNPLPFPLGGECPCPQNAPLEKLNMTNSTTWALWFQNESTKHKELNKRQWQKHEYFQKVYKQGRDRVQKEK